MRRLSVALAVLTVCAVACGGSTEGQFGSELYETSCSGCHRSTGSGFGSFPPIGAGSNAAQLSDEQIGGVIRAGAGIMPAFRRLTDEQVGSLVDFVRELQAQG